MPEHLELAKTTFNETWDYLDRDDRNEDDDRKMLAHAAASWYHWRQVGDDKNRSVSDWQMSRVLSVLGSADLARSFGEACLKISIEADLKPFYVGMAHEAIARAAAVGGDTPAKDEHLAAARAVLETIEDTEESEILAADLATIA
jgi:cation transport regulator ChaB